MHIFKIFFFAYLFYIVVALLENQFLGGNNSFNFSIRHIIGVLTVNVIPENVPGQLWFLLSLLEVYFVWFVLDYFHLRKLAYILACFSLLGMILLGQGAWLMGHSLPANYYRNPWTEGFFFFTLGYYLHDKQEKIVINNNALFFIILLSVVLSIVERFICGRIFAVHLSTYPLVIGLFIYAINNREKHEGLIQRVGKKYSMYVYILHMFWWRYYDRFIEYINIQDYAIMDWLRPIVVLGLTILTSMGCYFIFNRPKVQKNL